MRRPTIIAVLLLLLHGAHCLTSSPGVRLARPHESSRHVRILAARSDDPFERRWGNKTPEEIENMRKWGKILRTADTFDGDYLEKNKGGVPLNDGGQSGAAEVKALLLGGSALAALLFVSVQS
tara:strand:+ start:178 stop:546 length:369 start_codon:yes stop_codon:yes gene_type:complete